MSLAEIVNVQISRETRSVSRAGFGTPLILGSNGNFGNSRIQFFTDLASLAAALTSGTSAAEYAAAVDMLAQNPRVTRFAVGSRKGTKILTDNAGSFTAGTIKTTVNGTLVSTAFGVDKDTTLTAHAAAIQALTSVVTAVYNAGAHTITITPDTGYMLGIVPDTTLITGTMTWALTSNGTEDWDDALDAIQVENDDWYGVCCVTRVKSEQVDIAEWVETQRKVYAAGSADSEIPDTSLSGDTGSLAKALKDAAIARTFVVYTAAAGTEYPDAAALGKLLPYDPGTYTAKFKTLASITVDDLTTTQSTNVRDKKANSYELIGGVNILREGTVAEGEFIDVIIFIDWLQARIQEAVYALLVNQKKVPYTEAGMAAIKAEITQPLQIGQNRGGISPTAYDSENNQIGGFYVELPAFEDISSADKAARLLQDVVFVAWLAGAIHAVSIQGTVTL